MPATKRGKAACKPLASAPRWLLIAALAVIAVLALTLLVLFIRRALVLPAEGFADFGAAKAAGAAGTAGAAGAAEAQLVFLHMDGCGWCVKFQPVWEELEKKHGERLGEMGVTMASYERQSDAAAEFMASGHVKGFPTVLLVKAEGEVKAFEDDRTPAALLAFVEKEMGAAKRQPPASAEGFEADEPTEFGALVAAVRSAKKSAEGSRAGFQKQMMRSAGGKVVTKRSG